MTAGNASGINDGAAALLVTSAERARELGLQPIARIVSTAVAGVAPDEMGLGPDPGLAAGAEAGAASRADDMSVVEANEAFASQVIASLEELASTGATSRGSTRTAAPSRSAIRSAHPARGWPARPRWSFSVAAAATRW